MADEPRHLPAIKLTTSQKSRLRREYREACSLEHGPRRDHAIKAVYSKFGNMYGISHDRVRAVVGKPAKLKKAKPETDRPERPPLRRWPWDSDKSPKRLPKPTRVTSQREREQIRWADDYYGRTTYCPVCHRDFGVERMPPHVIAAEPTLYGRVEFGPHECIGEGMLGVTQSTIAHQERVEKLPRAKRRRRRRTTIRVVSGGLPGQGNRR